MRDLKPYLDYPVSIDRLMDNLHHICMWERLSGTEEEQIGREHV